MGKKAAASPEPPAESEASPTEEVQPVQLEGEFVFPDGSEYLGQYLKMPDRICFHGAGRLQAGPEVFEGDFDQGLYKFGTYKSCNGSVYKGSFRKNLFHGDGEYTWPSEQKYIGLWQDGHMHGRGRYENFSFGVDRIVEGFSVKGRFSSSIAGQEAAKRRYIEQYGNEYVRSATSVLVDLAANCGPSEPADPKAKKGAEDPPPEIPAELLVPNPPAEDEDADAEVERTRIEAIVSGPFPEAGVFKTATLKAFVAFFEQPEDGEPQCKGSVIESCEKGPRFDGTRLSKEQLAHIGQGVEFWAPDATEVGSISFMILVNVAEEHDLEKARWKIIHYEEVPPPEGEDAPPEGKKK